MKWQGINLDKRCDCCSFITMDNDCIQYCSHPKSSYYHKDNVLPYDGLNCKFFKESNKTYDQAAEKRVPRK